MDDTFREAAAKLGSALGYAFSDPEAVRRALTHRSAPGANNERLEFLGDSVLNLGVADLLFSRYPDATEGELTRARASLVRRESLAAIAREAGVGACLVLGAGEQRSGGRDRDSILANAVEALFGAMYLDGGYEAVRRAVERVFAERLARAAPGAGATAKDPKTRLQELLQARGLDLPRYQVVASDGSAHRPTFVVECDAGVGGPARGEGSSRRQAEQRAAERALAEIGEK